MIGDHSAVIGSWLSSVQSEIGEICWKFQRDETLEHSRNQWERTDQEIRYKLLGRGKKEQVTSAEKGMAGHLFLAFGTSTFSYEKLNQFRRGGIFRVMGKSTTVVSPGVNNLPSEIGGGAGGGENELPGHKPKRRNIEKKRVEGDVEDPIALSSAMV